MTEDRRQRVSSGLSVNDERRRQTEDRRQKKKERQAGFKSLVLALMLLLLVAVWWDKSDEITEAVAPTAAGKDRPGADQTVTTGAPGPAGGLPGKIKAPPEGWIKRAYFSYPKNKAGRSLKINVETKIPKTENQYFSYVYWKNGKAVEKGKENTLKTTTYKKGDVIFADVLLHQDGQELERKRSEMIQVANTSPIIKEVAIPEIVGPETYIITVKAEDNDKDKITFSLLNVPDSDPLPEGSEMKIDPATGTVTCVLGEKPPPGKLKFIIAADDGDGGVAKKVVTIPFKVYGEPAKNKNAEKQEVEGKGELP